MNQVSVIICCYNSAERLPETLNHLSKQYAPDITWELIIVNNNSSDNTEEIAKKKWDQFGSAIPMKVVTETKPGLSYARLKGVSSASYELLLFCDDDNWLDEKYITNGFAIMRDHSQYGIIGGKGYPYFENGIKPDWFDAYQGYYAVGAQSAHDGDVTLEKGYVYGAGTFIRKKVFKDLFEIGFTYSMEGRKGKNLSSSEDMELGYAAALIGYRIGYFSILTFQHFISSTRVNQQYLSRLKRGIAKSSIGMLPYEEMRRISAGNKKMNNYLQLFLQDLAQYINNGLRRFISDKKMKAIRTGQMHLHAGRIEGFIYFMPLIRKDRYYNLGWYIAFKNNAINHTEYFRKNN